MHSASFDNHSPCDTKRDSLFQCTELPCMQCTHNAPCKDGSLFCQWLPSSVVSFAYIYLLVIMLRLLTLCLLTLIVLSIAHRSMAARLNRRVDASLAIKPHRITMRPFHILLFTMMPGTFLPVSLHYLF